jgi:hypothetical protein|tara:strand:+ start:262 stop:576 length:315 start_codon:yes stop_codon:yes gene_type:complete
MDIYFMSLTSYSKNVSFHQIEINDTDEDGLDTLFDKLQHRIVSSMTKRTELDIPIKEIAKKTKIPVKFIKWIEKLDLKHLPPMPMRKAFILQYCQAIHEFNVDN